VKLFPQFVSKADIAYQMKGDNAGLYYTSGRPPVKGAMKAPQWSADGAQVIYQKVAFYTYRDGQKLYSWDKDWDYVYDDVFPALSRDGKTVVITEKAKSSSVVIMNPDGSNRRTVYDVDTQSGLNPQLVKMGLAGAFQPAWSPDGQWLAFGVGEWFFMRRMAPAKIMRVRIDGSGLEQLTDGAINCGYPSYSADGKKLVYRVYDEPQKQLGLRVLDLDTRKTTVLTDKLDNTPGWSPDGQRIVFTRKVDEENYDVFTIRPDGSDLTRLTTHRANDAHAVWTADGQIMWSSGYFGFRDEAAIYDNTFQPYGQIWIMNADGSGKRQITDTLWEDSMPLYLPAKA
jgi:Tol biopolymer transport system component